MTYEIKKISGLRFVPHPGNLNLGFGILGFVFVGLISTFATGILLYLMMAGSGIFCVYGLMYFVNLYGKDPRKWFVLGYRIELKEFWIDASDPQTQTLARTLEDEFVVFLNWPSDVFDGLVQYINFYVQDKQDVTKFILKYGG